MTSELLVLHAVRVLGFPDSPDVAARYGLDPDATVEFLLDAEARGWVQQARFAGLHGWSLTDAGRREGERLLAEELATTDRDDDLRQAYRHFLPLNDRVQQACTDWQLRPTAENRLLDNDHTDPAWDGAVLDTLDDVSRALTSLEGGLVGILDRFRGYAARFDAALRRVRAGDVEWVTRTDADSCHRVWFELHEDLIATLGLTRGDDSSISTSA